MINFAAKFELQAIFSQDSMKKLSRIRKTTKEKWSKYLPPGTGTNKPEKKIKFAKIAHLTQL